MSKSFNSIKAGWVNPNASSMGKRKAFKDIKVSASDFDVDDSYINSFLDDSRSYLQQSGKDTGNVNYKNASSEYDSKRSQWSSLRDRANTVRAFYNVSKANMSEESYNQMMEYLDAFDRGSSDVLNYYRDNKKFFSQFKTEDDCNKYVKDNELLQEMKTADLPSVGAEVSDLDSQIEAAKKKKKSYDDEYKKNGGYIYTPSNNTRVTPEQFAQYTVWSKQSDQYQKEIDELEKKRSQRGLYYNQAKNLQQEDRLTNEARQAEDFDKYVMAGATMENPTLKEAERIFGGKEIVNPVTYAREHKEEYASTNLNGNVDRFKTINPLYFLMKDEEVETYNYYLGKGDRKNADLYLKSIEEKLNSRAANNTYDLVKDNMALEYAFGVWAGLDQFSSGMKSLFNTEDEYIPASPVQIASGMVRENLADKGPEILGNSLGQAGYDFITTTSNMMPSIITSAVVGSVATPAVGAKVGTAIAGASGSTLLGASASGNAYQEMLNYGYDKGQARAYSALVGASEAGLQYVLGGIGSLGRGADGLFGGVTEQLLKRVDHVLARAAIQLGGNMLSEGSEEYLQDILEPWFRNLVFKEDNEIKLLSEEAMYSGLLGALSAGAFEGRKTINSELNIYRDGKYINKHGNTGALVDESLKLDANSLAYEIAEKAQAQIESKGKAKNGTVGKLFNEYASQSFVDDVAGRVNALGVKGAENLQEQLRNKSTLTNAIVNTVRGNKLTSTESAVFDANKETANRIISEIDNFGKEGHTNQWLNESYINKRIITGDKGVFDKSGNTMSVSRDGKTKPVSNERVELGRTFDVDVSDRLSDDGKTRTVDGKEITIDQSNPYAVSEDGKTYLNTNEGKVALEDVSFGTESEGLIYEAFAGMDTNIANLAVSRYHGQTPVRTYITGMLQGINVYGKYNFKGVGIDISKSSFLADLSDADQQYALKLGRMLADIETKSKQEVVKKSLTAAKDVKHQGKGTVRFEKGVSAKSEIQRKGVELARQLSRVTGVNIVFFDSTKDAKHKGDNGWFDSSDNSIHLDINAGNNLEGTIAYTLGHELTHFIEKWSPAKYKAFSDFLLEQYGEHGKSVEEMLEVKMAELKTDDVDEAMSELVADACQTMLLDSNAMEKLAQLRAQDRTLWDKIKEFVNKLLTDIKQLYKEYQPDSSEAKALREMEDVVGKISAMFEDAAVDAVENYNASQRNNTAQESATRYSIRENYEKDFDDWFNSTTREQRLKSGGFIRIGNTPDVLKKLGVPNGVFQMGKAKVQKILDKHSEMTPEFIKLVPRMVENPILIMDSRTVRNSFVVYGEMLTDDGHPIMASVLVTKTNAGTTATDVTVITSNYARSAGKVDNSNDQYLIDNSKIRYVNPDMKKTNNWLQSLRLQLPSDITNYGFIDRISQNQQNATGNIQKSQKRDNLYIAAIEKGDIQTAQNLVDEAAKNAGYTIKAYHGTTNQEEKRTWNDKLKIWDSEYKPFTVFKSQYPEQTGHFFSSDMDNAGGYGSNIYNVYLKFENPFVIDCKGQNYANISFRGKEMDTYEWARYAKKSGYDGVIFENISDGVGYDDLSRVTTDYVAFNSSQIKSADTVTYDNNGNVIPLSKRFSYMVDIRYSHRKDNRHVADRLTESEWRYFKEQIGHLKAGNQYEIAANNDIIIPVANKLVYTDGKYDNPGISKIIEFNSEYEGEIDRARRAIYAAEKGKSKIEDAYEIVELFLGQGGVNEYAVDDTQAVRKYDRRTERGKSKSDTYHREFLQDRIRDANEVIRKAASEGDGGVSQEQYSKRTLSNREILADALETTIDTSTIAGQYEAKYLKDYKENIAKLDELEGHLQEVNAEFKELSFAKGKRDMDRIRDLRDEKIKTQNRIGIYDKKLLRLEASKPLMDLLTREKEKVKKRYQEQGRERLNNYVSRRNTTALRARVKRIVGELNQLLLKETKEKHVQIGMQKVVAETLDMVNMDTVEADKRVAAYNDKIANETDPQVIEALTEKRDRIASWGDNLSEKMNKLKEEYAKIKNSDDPLTTGFYDEVIADKIETVRENVGDTPLRSMNREQLEDVYDMYKMILTSVRNANKTFKMEKSATIRELGTNTMSEVFKTGGSKNMELKAAQWLKKAGWSYLKPIYAMRLIGSDTLTRLYNNVRAGEDTWYVDVNEAKDFKDSVSKKYGYGKWDFEKQYTYTAKNGKEFSMSLSQMMSLYAYSKRAQAIEHLTIGGIVFDNAIEVKEKKAGVPLTYHVNTANAFNLSEQTISEIAGALTDEQRGFVDEMQAYLSEVMGAKGNEVSLSLYGIKLFKEQFYFPLKSSNDYLYQPNQKDAGEVRVKNMGASKKTVEHANNPVILSDFIDVWASHVNEMSMYHAFVLPLEDFNRVYNYKTPSNEDNNTESVKQYLQNAYGSGVNEYIRQLLTDLNGGARNQGGGTEVPNKFISMFKKNAVFASASVAIQQPSAVIRAMAHINPVYFVASAPHQFNFKQHSADWAECKRYAPIAGIKEMGYFDTGMGQSTVDWIKTEEYEGFRKKVGAFFRDGSFRDEVFSKAPALADEVTWCHIWNAVKREVSAKTDLQGEEYMKRCGERFTEIITLTQVYDSVLARSGMMRSNDLLMKTATSFMAEPTTTMNMVVDSWVQGRRIGGMKGLAFAGRTVGAVLGSIVLNSLLKSFVMAWRDDDDEKTYGEAYWDRVTSDFWDSINPLTYIPFAKDILSIFQGYDVNRADMSLFEDFKGALDTIASDKKTPYQKVTAIIGAVSAFLGVPMKNVERDIRPLLSRILRAQGISLVYKSTSQNSGRFIEYAASGEENEASAYYDEWVETKKVEIAEKRKKEGKMELDDTELEEKAKSGIKSSVTSKLRKAYIEAYKSKNDKEMAEIRKKMLSTGLYGSGNDVVKTCQNWVKEYK